MQGNMNADAVMTLEQAEAALVLEARLLDTRRLDEWLTLFTDDGIYWIPLDDEAPIGSIAAIVHDTPLRREERVHHLLHDEYPAQSPPSRTVHFVSNVEVAAAEEGFLVRSNQIVYEMRTGDYSQVGIGEIRPIVARVEHLFRRVENKFLIANKKILLINRDGWLGNMTFLL